MPVLLLSGHPAADDARAGLAAARSSDVNPFKHVVDGVRAFFRGDIGTPTTFWGVFATVCLAAAGLWLGTRTFQRESS